MMQSTIVSSQKRSIDLFVKKIVLNSISLEKEEIRVKFS